MLPRAIILTALPVEYEAVRAHLSNLREVTHPRGTVYEVGSFFSEIGESVWEVAIVEVGKGNTRAAVEGERAINHFEPSFVFFVGIAGGMQDVNLGDVVAATKVYGYEFGKAKSRFKSRPEVGNSTYALVERAKAEARKTDWLQRLAPFATSQSPRVLIGPIAAGEKVIVSRRSQTYKFLRSNYSDAIAVEMEGSGFMRAIHANPGVEALIIRGISDLIHGKASSDVAGYQQTAARHASAFTFEILAKLTQTFVEDKERITWKLVLAGDRNKVSKMIDEIVHIL